MAVVYLHKRNDTNEVFYVGIGKTEKRAFDKNKNRRSQYWKRIVEKVGYTVDILHSDVSWGEACEIEKLLIENYGRKDLGLGNLVNMTDGGDGMVGLIFSEETRQKMSEWQKGKKLSEETKQKLSGAHKGKTHSEETRQKISEIHKGKKRSEETRQKMSEANKGEKNPNFGKTCSEETKQKISLFNRNKEGVKGYTFDKSRNKYKARIKVGGKYIHLGLFNTPEEAELAYKQGKLKYHI